MKPFYTVVDVARETGINRGTVARWLDDGKFPAERKSVGSVTAWTMTPEVFEAVCQHAKERKVAPRVAMTVNLARKAKPEPVAVRREWSSVDEMIAAHRAGEIEARYIAPAWAEGAEVWA
jgi:predicted DNA-binding transcriptional regulator AlpA